MISERFVTEIRRGPRRSVPRVYLVCKVYYYYFIITSYNTYISIPLCEAYYTFI